ncbi:MAG: hypothetical protein H5T86_10035, partial [Armatimonadetes bacterium]|nr:hypothetical protein [Armatimonadota bacterium]
MSAIVSAILAMIAWPLSFETEADLQQLRPSGLKVFERVQQRATDGQWALRVVFPGSDRDTWPGFWLDLSQQKITQKSVLVFHVINATGSPRVLSWRVDDADGRREFGSSSVPAAKQALMQIWLGGLRYQLNLERLTGVYIYVRIPRE